ncbi:hypothetical protein DUNSADRAFT_395 [Dunaliella salina]|uniref:Uncharacterized protein n=1 Tax=Dunaliella salina TaxID=3046 RepID=A0ABQ7GYD0_DUNSA|nr:hypothetical protein DUNSADRAFT_395 [Dunaliella salina]|eukprot:KAF5839616.1 hypothetical protein DUNSADRAFT_395 [Dunaliella salina]
MESIVSERAAETDPCLVVEVYEASCDAACAAGAAAFPELLKSLQALVGPDGEELYVRAAAQQQRQQQRPQQHNGDKRASDSQLQEQQQQQQQQQPEGVGRPHQHPPMSSETPLPGPAAQTPASLAKNGGRGAPALNPVQPESAAVAAAPLQTKTAPPQQPPPLTSRAAEMAAAHVLFFACVPHSVRKMEVVNMMAAAAKGPHWGSPCMQYAIQVCSSLAKADVHGFLRLRSSAPPPVPGNSTYSRLLRELVDAKLAQVQRMAVSMAASAYRSLPAAAVAPILLGQCVHVAVGPPAPAPASPAPPLQMPAALLLSIAEATAVSRATGCSLTHSRVRVGPRSAQWARTRYSSHVRTGFQGMRLGLG